MQPRLRRLLRQEPSPEFSLSSGRTFRRLLHGHLRGGHRARRRRHHGGGRRAPHAAEPPRAPGLDARPDRPRLYERHPAGRLDRSPFRQDPAAHLQHRGRPGLHGGPPGQRRPRGRPHPGPRHPRVRRPLRRLGHRDLSQRRQRPLERLPRPHGRARRLDPLPRRVRACRTRHGSLGPLRCPARRAQRPRPHGQPSPTRSSGCPATKRPTAAVSRPAGASSTSRRKAGSRPVPSPPIPTRTPPRGSAKPSARP